MKKIFLLFAFAAIFSVKAQAQVQLGLHAGVGIPMGTFGDASKLGIGGGGNFKYLLSDNFALGANVSYYTFGGKDLGIPGFEVPSLNLIPIHANAEYYFGDGSTKPFIGADLGVTMSSVSGIDGSGETNLSFAPILGIKFGLGDSVDLFGNAKYNVVTGDGESQSYVGINFGLLFNLGQ
jgi:opacity protein-like surface antigen